MSSVAACCCKLQPQSTSLGRRAHSLGLCLLLLLLPSLRPLLPFTLSRPCLHVATVARENRGGGRGKGWYTTYEDMNAPQTNQVLAFVSPLRLMYWFFAMHPYERGESPFPGPFCVPPSFQRHKGLTAEQSGFAGAAQRRYKLPFFGSRAACLPAAGRGDTEALIWS